MYWAECLRWKRANRDAWAWAAVAACFWAAVFLHPSWCRSHEVAERVGEASLGDHVPDAGPAFRLAPPGDPRSTVGLGACVAAEPQAWPGFLGQGASAIDPATIPVTWAPDRNIAWKARLPGYGQSSPVIWGDKVFVTSVEGPMKDTWHVSCLSLADGKLLWRHSLENSVKVENGLYTSRAAPTPVVDAQHLYAYFESGDLVALTHTGEPVWQRSLSESYGKFENPFGLGSSPTQTNSSLFVLADHRGPSYLVAISKQTGQTVWKRDRDSRLSWSSPAVLTIGGIPQIVCSSAGSVDGYRAADGQLLWSYGEVGGNTAATPLAFGDGCFLIGASPGREDRNLQAARRSNLAMRVTRQQQQWVPVVVWRNGEGMASFGSPIVHQECGYWISRVGVLYCLDAATGEPHYIERVKQPCWATPLGLGDRVYLFGKDGLTTVLAAGPEFRLLSENLLWNPETVDQEFPGRLQPDPDELRRFTGDYSGPVQYGVAAVTGSLLIRTGQVLYCVRAVPDHPADLGAIHPSPPVARILESKSFAAAR